MTKRIEDELRELCRRIAEECPDPQPNCIALPPWVTEEQAAILQYYLDNFDELYEPEEP